ncbi:hypothetical protein DSO57_1008160 [Entomophthora muscae]|uniref:Uncharacterized protein n=1 Tax=Entomophthora muscae TaxID=34485 RepID=A0ACC2T6Y9_9FUNG|nr:hypothetical protein DSO57_1008160 [Entomophthora muscae]
MFFQSLFIALVYCQARCRKIHDRVEIRDMQASDRLAYFDAIKALAANRTQGQSEYDRIVKIHVLNAHNVHKTPLFLAWHRHYLHHFQMKLFELNSSIVIPYWDTGMDSQKPEESEIFTQDYYGGTGNEILDHCLANGQFTSMRVTVEDQQPNGTFRRCIRRQFDGKTKISSFFSSDLISPIIRNNNFTEFTSQIEIGPHAPPHNNIGGQRGHMGRMSSPNDPIFWIHHANVDYWYAQWQDSFGKDNYIPGKENDPLPHFSPTTVKDTFDTLAYPYCYRYVPKIVPPINPSLQQTPSDQEQTQPNNPSTSQNIQPTDNPSLQQTPSDQEQTQPNNPSTSQNIQPTDNPSLQQTPSDQEQTQPNNPSTSQNIQPTDNPSLQQTPSDQEQTQPNNPSTSQNIQPTDNPSLQQTPSDQEQTQPNNPSTSQNIQPTDNPSLQQTPSDQEQTQPNNPSTSQNIQPTDNPSLQQTPSDQEQTQPNNPSTSQNIQPTDNPSLQQTPSDQGQTQPSNPSTSQNIQPTDNPSLQQTPSDQEQTQPSNPSTSQNIQPTDNPSLQQTPSDQEQTQPSNPSTSQNIQPNDNQLVITNLHRRQNTPALGSNPDQLLLALKEACPANVCPDAFDRNDLRRLRVPKPTPLRWILMNNLDLAEVRRQEIANAMLIFALNRNENYQSKDSIGMWSYYHYTSSSSRTSSQSNRTSKSRQVTRTILSITG